MPVEKRPDERDHLKRPIILIGAGRSGSTLFVRILNAHPDVQFEGETDFLVARLWREVWDNRFWLKSQHNMLHRLRDLTSSRSFEDELPQEAFEAAKERAAWGVRRLFADILQIDPNSAAWGFKEIWNGNEAVAQVPWDAYDAIFPNARWVHLVRNPFAFAQSSAKWNQMPLTIKLLRTELCHWRQIVEWSRQLKDRDSFFEIRFEDLIATPQACLTPILTSAGLAWHENCARELGRRLVASKESAPCAAARTLKQAQIEKMIGKTSGLARLMNEFGYSAPRELEIKEREDDTTAPLAKRVRKALKQYARSDDLSRAVGRIR